jgi:hypothetical protein
MSMEEFFFAGFVDVDYDAIGAGAHTPLASIKITVCSPIHFTHSFLF